MRLTGHPRKGRAGVLPRRIFPARGGLPGAVLFPGRQRQGKRGPRCWPDRGAARCGNKPLPPAVCFARDKPVPCSGPFWRCRCGRASWMRGHGLGTKSGAPLPASRELLRRKNGRIEENTPGWRKEAGGEGRGSGAAAGGRSIWRRRRSLVNSSGLILVFPVFRQQKNSVKLMKRTTKAFYGKVLSGGIRGNQGLGFRGEIPLKKAGGPAD